MSFTPPWARIIASAATGPTVYADWLAGDDTRDGLTPSTAVKNIQRAVDIAASLFQIIIPINDWTDNNNCGYRSGVTVQLAQAPANNPYLLPQPVFLDGLAASAPIYLRGDPLAPTLYNIKATNVLQGITAQNGGVMICDGFSITGIASCTYLNALQQGKMAVRNVRFAPTIGGAPNGTGGFIGAADQSRIDIIGPIYFDGDAVVPLLALEDRKSVV